MATQEERLTRIKRDAFHSPRPLSLDYSLSYAGIVEADLDPVVELDVTWQSHTARWLKSFLIEQQKQENRAFNRQRVDCEQTHAGIKCYSSVSAVCRNRVTDFDELLMLVAAGLWNFYLAAV